MWASYEAVIPWENGLFQTPADALNPRDSLFPKKSMDCRLTTRDGEPAVEWTWDGNDEMDPAQGRGWAVVKGDELHGMIFFHGGDDSEFVAKKKGPSRKKPKK